MRERKFKGKKEGRGGKRKGEGRGGEGVGERREGERKGGGEKEGRNLQPYATLCRNLP